MTLPVTAIVMTLNEERNIRPCLESLRPHVSRIMLIDSGSTDSTLSIAREFGCDIYSHTWVNHANQLRWALDLLPDSEAWILRVDADERWTPEGFALLAPLLARSDLSGIYVRMRIMFMGRWLRHGGMYPNLFLRVFRRNRASVEHRWMDEHVSVVGDTLASQIDVLENNHDRASDIALWTAKHNRYSTNEAIDYFLRTQGVAHFTSIASLRGGPTERKRWYKEHVYLRLPLLLAPFLYFGFRYFCQLGFLDGTRGFIYHVLQGFWYRFLVAVKILQVRSEARRLGLSPFAVIESTFGVSIGGN